MMTLLWLLSAAFAGQIVFDVRTPARIVVGDRLAAELYEPGVVKLERKAGTIPVVVTVGSTVRKLVVVLDDTSPARVLVSKTGISVLASTPVAVEGEAADGSAAQTAQDPEASGQMSVTLHTNGTSKLMIVIGDQRYVIAPGRDAVALLSVGDHNASLRNGDGTQLYAQGLLRVSGAGQAIVQFSEGRIPEASGEHLAWFTGGD